MNTATNYTAVTRVRAGDKLYLPDDKVPDLPAKEAAELLAAGAIVACTDEQSAEAERLEAERAAAAKTEAERLEAEKAAADAVNADALKREKAATKTKVGKETWAAAELRVREASSYSEAEWRNLADSDRVARIEQALAG